MASLSDMSQNESVRKLQQLRPIFSPDDQTRGFDTEQVTSTDLSFVVENGQVDGGKLIPFIVSALQNVFKRLDAIEAQLADTHQDL